MARVLIVGSGPAGVSAALYAVRSGAEVLVVSTGSGALEKAGLIQNYYGFSTPLTGRELEQEGIEGAKKLGVHFVQDEIVWLGMKDSLDGFAAEGSSGERYEADAMILAAGSKRNAPRISGIEEFDGRGISYCAICDAFFYRGKTAAVLGAGDYALHELETLRPHAAKLLLFTNGEEPSADFPADVEIHTQKVAAVEGNQRVQSVRMADGSSVDVHGVFVAYGSAGSSDFARKIGAAVDGKNLIVDENMATNIPGLFAAGDCTGGLLQVAKAVYQGAVAGLAAVRYLREAKP